MYHYLFTNDLRISNLDESLQRAGECFLTNTVPSASEDKSANNNMKTLGFYFNLTADSNCAKEAANGNIRAVVLNFIKKFQFPNLRTKEAFTESKSDGIYLAPMRMIVKVLYCMNLLYSNDDSFLTKEEISKFFFYNSGVAKNKNTDLSLLIKNILEFRKTGKYPESVEVDESVHVWKHEDRQLREMIKVLVWSGCIVEKDNKLYIDSSKLSRDNKADIYDILNYNVFWEDSDLESYQAYMDLEESSAEYIDKSLDNIYVKAAKMLVEHKEESGYAVSEESSEFDEVVSEFTKRFSPKALSELSDDLLLKTLFYTTEKTNDSMCYWLEFNNKSRELLGSIAGGSSFKFGLFQSQDSGAWITGSPAKQKELTESEALVVGKEIRDLLVKGCEVIDSFDLSSPEDYEALDDKLNEVIGRYAALGWVHKYFEIIYPDKFSVYHSFDWQKHVLYALGIKPSEKYYGRSGQIAIIRNYTGFNPCEFGEIFYDKYGAIKRFIRIGTTQEDESLADELRKQNTVGMGWKELGPLTEFASGKNIDKKSLAETMTTKFYSDKPQVATRKAGEFVTFYAGDINTIFVPMEGEKLLALADEVGDYYYDEGKEFAHRKPAKWHNCFNENDSLPNKSEGHLTTCYELTDPDNLLYLYDKYFNGENFDLEEEEMSSDRPYIAPVYNTGLVVLNSETQKEYAHNRIVFGAPGTGKSFKLNEEQKDLIRDGGEVERVTFHPDYSYSHFVGTYKPVPSASGISYEYVPGPFMRTYVSAIRNGRSENAEDVKPYLLLIEEINRANVAAVFGEVFQLLDRDNNNQSQYAVKPSEDIKAYLAKELGGVASDYKELIIPDNMYIWSTMNSADQGVFPMDTAFKRRWDFEYIGINHNDSKIEDAFLVCAGAKPAYKVNWNELRKAINNTLSSKDYKINEDKLMGPFFVASSVLADEENFREVFKSKVIMYLFEDAAKQRRSNLFSGCDDDTRTKYSTICDDFDKRGIDIFCNDIRERVNKVFMQDVQSEGADE